MVERYMVGLSLHGGANKGRTMELGGLDSVSVVELCSVSSFLITNVIQFLAMKSMLPNLCHPHGGVSISSLGDKRFLFQFYYEIDFDRFLKGSPWTFNGHLLVFHRLHKGEDPLVVPLTSIDF